MSATPVKVLVTGASGFLGRHVVQRLVRDGHTVTGLVRSASGGELVQSLGGRALQGDVTQRDAMAEAIEQADCVVHAAADTTGSDKEGDRVTVGGSRLVAELCKASAGTRLLYVSSCSVYDVAGAAAGSLLNEDAALEPDPAGRGAYSRCKHEAERVVLDTFTEEPARLTVLRPGIIYGKDAAVFSPSLGFSLRNRLFAVIGPAAATLPLVHVDTVAAAVARLLGQADLPGPFNVIDPAPVSKRQYMDRWVRRRFPRAWVVYIPYPILQLVVVIQEKLLRAIGRRPFLTRYRLRSSQNPVQISGQRLYDALAWTPARSFESFASENGG